MKTKFLCTGGVLLAAASAALFLFLCFVTASDAQGAIALVILGPVLFLLIGGSVALLRSVRGRSPFARAGHAGAWVLVAFYVFFYSALWVPGMNSASQAVIRGVAGAFRSVTGKSPYEWTRRAR